MTRNQIARIMATVAGIALLSASGVAGAAKPKDKSATAKAASEYNKDLKGLKSSPKNIKQGK